MRKTCESSRLGRVHKLIQTLEYSTKESDYRLSFCIPQLEGGRDKHLCTLASGVALCSVSRTETEIGIKINQVLKYISNDHFSPVINRMVSEKNDWSTKY